MPLYEYRCAPCGGISTYRRSIEERTAPAVCSECGGAAIFVFTPTSNIHVPISFRQVLTGGEPGGGGLSWSDFHDMTEKELAHVPGVERVSTAASQAGAFQKQADTPATRREQKRGLERAYTEAKQMAAARN